MALLRELYVWMQSRENTHLEFKEAKNTFDITKLTQYCCAFANEGGGRVVLGISDQIPRKIVGSQAYQNLEKIKSHLIFKLSLRIEVEELFAAERRIVIVTIPSRPIGVPIQFDGISTLYKNSVRYRYRDRYRYRPDIRDIFVSIAAMRISNSRPFEC